MKHIKMMILTDYKGSVRSDGAIHELIIIRIRLYQVKTKVHVKPYRIFREIIALITLPAISPPIFCDRISSYSDRISLV